MRLWSLHPSLLDSQGLVALWREALLAQKVLQGKMKGYRHHPQLQRFEKCKKPITAIATYLWAVHDEATARGYAFDQSKIIGKRHQIRLPVSRGQMAFEWAHLKKKVCLRAPAHFQEIRCRRIKIHPMFIAVAGKIERWERGR